MIKIKKGLILLLAAVMATTIVGCSTGKDVSGSQNNIDKISANDGPVTPYEPGIEIQFGSGLDQNGSQVVALEKLTGEKYNDNRWTRLFKEKLGITTKYKLLATGDEYNQKLKMAIVSGDLPDMFLVNDYGDLSQLAAAGAIEEMGPIYEKYATPLLKDIIEKEGISIFDPVSQNGKIYGIPVKMPSTNDFRHLWLREDWLKNLSLERPKTMKDVYDIANAFVKNDPDGNDKADTFGLNMDKDFLYNLSGLFWGFSAYPTIWLEESGKISRGIIKPEMKPALQMLQTMYKEGLIDKEFGAKDAVKASESYISGKCGMFYGPHWNAFDAEKVLKIDPKAKWIVVPLPMENGKDIKQPLTLTMDGAEVVRKGFKNPEALIKMLNIDVDRLFGPEPEFNKYFGENGIDGIWYMTPVHAMDPMVDLRAHQEIKKAIIDNTTDKLTGAAQGFYKNMQAGMWSFSMMFGPTDTPFALIDQLYPDHVIWNAYFGAPTPTMIERWSSLDELITTRLTSIVQGKSEVDSGFDKLVSDWLSMGGEKITKEINDIKGKM